VASATGEWIWRPLDNPEELSISSFQAPNPQGFGLLQRDRDFDHYQDFETRAERRPSAWVVPKGEWGPGRIVLVEIPTHNDSNDNVVAFWVPETPLQPGTEHRFAYDLAWYDDEANQPPGGRTVGTRIDRGTFEDAYRFVIDFEGTALGRLPAETVLEGVVTIGSGDGSEATLVEQQVIKNPATGGWRLVFQIQPKTRDAFDIRAFLRKGAEASTETWSYLLHP
jgi:glucans biosynthesis protein